MQDVIIWGIWVKGMCNLGGTIFATFYKSNYFRMKRQTKDTLEFLLTAYYCVSLSKSLHLSEPQFSLPLDQGMQRDWV